MGVLNITPDSFFDNSRFNNLSGLKSKIKDFKDSDIIDIGAESTRPSSKPLGLNDELNRLDIIFDNIDLFQNKTLSIDTYKPEVAKKALESGFSIVNDIYGGKNSKIFALTANFNAKVVIMHINGVPETMQNKIHYDSLIDDIIAYLEKQASCAIDIGVKESNIIIDPGIGFGKTLSDNYKIINNIDRFKRIGFDVMIGLSRKSFLSIKNDTPVDRLPATICANTVALLNGADIIRVHDVKEHSIVREVIANFKNNK